MTWTVKVEGNHLWFPEMPLDFEDFNKLKKTLDTLYSLLNTALTIQSELFLICPDAITYTMPSGLIITICHKVGNDFVLNDFTIDEPTRTEKIITWGLWPMPYTYLHFNLYPWQSWWDNYLYNAKIDVKLVDDLTFVDGVRDYMLSDALVDIGTPTIIASVLFLMAKYGFTGMKDLYATWRHTTTQASVTNVQTSLNDLTDPSVTDLSNTSKTVGLISDTLVRIKQFYRGSYV